MSTQDPGIIHNAFYVPNRREEHYDSFFDRNMEQYQDVEQIQVLQVCDDDDNDGL